MSEEGLEPTRPTLSKPREESWASDDELLSKFLENVQKTLLQIENWSVKIANTTNKTTYGAFCNSIDVPLTSLDVNMIQTMQKEFLNLDDRFEIIRKSLIITFRNFTLNLRDRTNYTNELSKYADTMEKKLEYQNELISAYKQNEGVASFNDKLNQMSDVVVELQRAVSDLATKEEVVVKPIEEAVELPKNQKSMNEFIPEETEYDFTH